jgi:hypothetical protein
MPTFDTPSSITLSLELGVGDVRIDATDRRDTNVEVRPGDPSKKEDVAAAQRTTVEFANGTLLIRAPKGWTQWMPWGGRESIDVHVELPAGSAVNGSAGVAALRCTGRIGSCSYRTGVGDVSLEGAGAVDVKTGAGEVTADRVDGRTDVRTAGRVRIGRIDGDAAVRNSNGDTWIGEVTGEARVNASNGAITIDHARAGVVAKTANGSVSLGEVARGAVVAQSALGNVEVGVAAGVPAWLELETKFGQVRNSLDDAERPEAGEPAVEIRAYTSMGDIVIRRAVAAGSEGGAR